MKLVDVYEANLAYRTLFDLLKERGEGQNISHEKMPSYDDHVEVVEARPYRAWYMVEKDKNISANIVHNDFIVRKGSIRNIVKSTDNKNYANR